MAVTSVSQARTVLGDDVLGAEALANVLGQVSAAELRTEIPFTSAALAAARNSGMMLVLRLAQADDRVPLTIVQMLQRFPQAFDQKLLRQMGYQLKDEWGIALEPLAATETCTPGWALVRKDVLEDSCNLSYDEQDTAIRNYAAMLGDAAVRRRTAVEAVYDTLLYFEARKIRLLERSWDWSSSATLDGGYLNVGGFASAGMQVLSYSRAVRHGQLGVCPTCQPIK
ncbi:MAG TPA: hypothetical protein VF515_05985 [Candidatus Binatia bacterium]|jgi:hypothetical protein